MPPDVPEPEGPVEPLPEPFVVPFAPELEVSEPDEPLEPLPEALVAGASVGVALVGRPAPDVEISPGDVPTPDAPVASLELVVAPLVPDALLDELCATATSETPNAETSNATNSLFICHPQK